MAYFNRNAYQQAIATAMKRWREPMRIAFDQPEPAPTVGRPDYMKGLEDLSKLPKFPSSPFKG